MVIAVLDDYHGAFQHDPAIDRLRQRAEVRVYTRPLTPEERPRELRDVEIVIALRERTRFDEAFFRDAPQLKLIAQTGGVGPHLDMDAATRAGVLVATGRGGSSASTVELTFALMMAVMRRIPQSDALLRRGQWVTPFGVTLHGKTLGIVGLGRIGKDVARIAGAFGMKVLAWGRSLTAEQAAAVGASAVSLEEVLGQSDVVSVHLALNAGTRGFLTKEHLGLMKSGAFFVNTARGAIVDEAALLRLLQTGYLAGAGLDVFMQEPLPADSPFLTLENVVLTPHAGWPADISYVAFAEACAQNIEAFLDGTPKNVVNPAAAT